MRILTLFIFLFTFSAYPYCGDKIQTKILDKEAKLVFAKNKQKKVIKGTFVGTGIATGILYGTAFKLIADGATIPAAILVGGGFGLVGGSIAAGAVAIPIITYNQIIKAQIRGLRKANQLLEDALSENAESRLLKKMLRKVRRKDRSVDMALLMKLINEANDKEVFCLENEKIYSFNRIKKYLINAPDFEEESELSFVLN